LREALGARLSRNRSLLGRAATASDPIMLERAIILQRLFIGDMEAQNVTAFVGDYHVFSLWGMLEEPTLLLGMDVLTQARAIAIDYGRATVSFRID
jgi:hypothetical protein